MNKFFSLIYHPYQKRHEKKRRKKSKSSFDITDRWSSIYESCIITWLAWLIRMTHGVTTRDIIMRNIRFRYLFFFLADASTFFSTSFITLKAGFKAIFGWKKSPTVFLPSVEKKITLIVHCILGIWCFIPTTTYIKSIRNIFHLVIKFSHHKRAIGFTICKKKNGYFLILQELDLRNTPQWFFFSFICHFSIRQGLFLIAWC